MTFGSRPGEALRKVLVKDILTKMVSAVAQGVDVGACEFYDAIVSSDSFPEFKALILSTQSPNGPERTEALAKYVLADMLMKEKVSFVAVFGKDQFLAQGLEEPDESLRVRVFVQGGNVEFHKEKVSLYESA